MNMLTSNVLDSVPTSLVVFLFTAIAYVLQISPLPGIFLLMFGAPCWSIITVNIGFLLVLFDIKTGRLPAWCVAAPLIYFGGFVVLATASHLEVDKVKKAIAQENSAVRIPFDSTKEFLVFKRAITLDNQSLANTLLYQYDLPAVYEVVDFAECKVNRFEKIDPNRSPFPSRKDYEIDKTNDVFRKVVYENPGQSLGKVQGICWAQRRDVCPDRSFTIETKINYGAQKDWFLNKTLEVISITDLDGQIHRLTACQLTPIAWFPLPVLGYALNDGNSSWDKINGFIQLGTETISAQDAVASALNLRAASPSSRLAQIH